MPDLPQIEPEVQARPADAPSAVAPDQAYGAGVGAAAENVAEVASRIHHDEEASYHEAMDQFNQAKVLDAHNRLQAFNEQAIYNPRTGITGQNLMDGAPKAVDALRADYQKQVASLSAGLTNNEQKAQFARIAADNQTMVDRHLDAYQSEQIERYHAQVLKGTLAAQATAAQNNAMAGLSAQTPQAQAAAMADGADHATEVAIAAMRDENRRNNVPAIAQQAQESEYRSQVTYNVISAALARGADQAASAYYDAHKDQLQGEHAVQAARMVDAGSTMGEASRMAPGIAFTQDGSVSPTAMEDVDKIDDPKLREAVRVQVTQRIQDKEVDTERANTATAEGLYHQIIANDGRIDAATMAQMQRLPPHMEAQLMALGRQRGYVDPEVSAQNEAKYRQMQIDNPQEFMKTNFAAQYATMTPDARKAMEEDRRQMLAGERTEQAHLSRKIVDALKENGIKPGSKDAGLFDQRVRDAVEMQGGAGKMGDDGMDRLIAREMTRSGGGWFSSGIPLYQRSDAALAKEMQASPDRLRRARDILRARGMANPSDAQITRLAAEMP